MLELKNPDFKTAVRVADAVNAFTRTRFHTRGAHEEDLRRVTLLCPPGVGATRFMAEIGDLTVEPDVPARVVIDERTGTVVIGEDVQISTVAVTHGSLTVRITETPAGVAARAAVGRQDPGRALHRHLVDASPRARWRCCTARR